MPEITMNSFKDPTIGNPSCTAQINCNNEQLFGLNVV